MDGLTLLRQAREAGLAVVAEGEKLVIRGPRRAELLARLLIEHKPEVLTALVSAEDHPVARDRDYRVVIEDPARWRDLFAARLVHCFMHGGRHWHEAELIAFNECILQWHRHHGRRWPAWQCAGCNEATGGLAALTLADGNRLHCDKLDCLLSFGDRWRGEAAAGLQALGLDPPDGFEPL
jgi:hypothetical protein